MAALRYLLFVAVGLVVASVLFLILSFLVTANRDASVGFFERWIVKYTCDQYELKGTIRDTATRASEPWAARATVTASKLRSG